MKFAERATRVKTRRQPKPALRRICSPVLGLSFVAPSALVCAIAIAADAPTVTPAPAGTDTAAGRPKALAAPMPELKGRRIEDVRISGNTTVPYTIIRNLVRSQVGDAFDPATVQDDYQRIFDLKKFANVQARVEPTQSGGVIVDFEVAEQKLIKSISFAGNRAVTKETLKTKIDLKDGEAIDTFRISLARQAILNEYKDQNYPMAHVDVDDARLSQTGELVFRIVEGPHVVIRNIEFVGNKQIPANRLREHIKTGTYFFIFSAGKYDPEQVDEDVAAVRHYYESKGFFDARVDRKLIFSPDQSELEIDFVIDEGRQYIVQNIRFEGNSHVTDAQMRALFKLTPGMAWDEELVDRDRKQIIAAYSPLGYIYEQGSSDPDYLRIEPRQIYLNDPGKVDLVYQIHEGKPFKLGNIYVRGNDKSQSILVYREFRDLAPGLLYNSGAVQDAEERLKALPYFQGVTVTPIGDDPKYRDLLVEVNEARTASISVGAGINSNGGVGGNFTYRQSNFDISNVPDSLLDSFNGRSFTGRGQTFIASFEPGTIATNASLRFVEPYVFDQPYSFSNEIYLRDRLREAYDDRRLGDRIGIGKRFDYTWTGSVNVRAEEVKIYQIQDSKFRSEQILDAYGSHPLTSLSLSIRRDTTNPGALPYRGSVTQFIYEYVGAFGGDYRFHRLQLNYDSYFALSEDLQDRKTVLAFHGFTGYIPGNSPFFERYYGGGIGSIRGFRFRGVEPRDGRENDPIGGNFALTGSVELNVPIYTETLRGVIFSDFGDVEQQAHLGTIRSSVGAGIRLVLPFLGQAPLAIDFAVPVTRGTQDESQLISFSLGFTQ